MLSKSLQFEARQECDLVLSQMTNEELIDLRTLVEHRLSGSNPFKCFYGLSYLATGGIRGSFEHAKAFMAGNQIYGRLIEFGSARMTHMEWVATYPEGKDFILDRIEAQLGYRATHLVPVQVR